MEETRFWMGKNIEFHGSICPDLCTKLYAGGPASLAADPQYRLLHLYHLGMAQKCRRLDILRYFKYKTRRVMVTLVAWFRSSSPILANKMVRHIAGFFPSSSCDFFESTHFSSQSQTPNLPTSQLKLTYSSTSLTGLAGDPPAQATARRRASHCVRRPPRSPAARSRTSPAAASRSTAVGSWPGHRPEGRGPL